MEVAARSESEGRARPQKRKERQEGRFPKQGRRGVNMTERVKENFRNKFGALAAILKIANSRLILKFYSEALQNVYNEHFFLV